MIRSLPLRLGVVLGVVLLLAFASSTIASPAQKPDGRGDELKFVLYLSRHGVRSPTEKIADFSRYAALPWPQWDVPRGYLTAHGYKLMVLFGAYDRAQFTAQGLLTPSGCEDVAHVTIHADSDERSRETAKAMVEGMLPGCEVALQVLPQGAADPLFHSLKTGVDRVDQELAVAAIGGRIGGDAKNLTEAYRSQLTALDQVLAGCGHAPASAQQRASIFEAPASLGPGARDEPVELRGPLSTAATMAEDFLLEYTEGMPASSVGWGCVDGAALRSLMQLHSAGVEVGQRTPMIARMQASNLLDHLLRVLEQQTTGKPVAGAPGKPGDRVLLLVAHDTNIVNVAGALGLHWIIDGRYDDSPPGGALVFELWRSRAGGAYSVRTYYTAQTLEQMRDALPLTLDRPPARVPVFVPGCGTPDLSCPWEAFTAAMRKAIDPRYVSAKP